MDPNGIQALAQSGGFDEPQPFVSKEWRECLKKQTNQEQHDGISGFRRAKRNGLD